jgi:hypothetical protein
MSVPPALGFYVASKDELMVRTDESVPACDPCPLTA